jgi:hypothetical protein
MSIIAASVFAIMLGSAEPVAPSSALTTVDFALQYAAEGLRSRDTHKQLAALSSIELLLDVPGAHHRRITAALRRSAILPELAVLEHTARRRVRRRAAQLLASINQRLEAESRHAHLVVPTRVDDTPRFFELPDLDSGTTSVRFRPGHVGLYFIRTQGCADRVYTLSRSDESVSSLWHASVGRGGRFRLTESEPLYFNADEFEVKSGLAVFGIQAHGTFDCTPSFALGEDVADDVQEIAGSQHVALMPNGRAVRVISPSSALVRLQPVSARSEKPQGAAIYQLSLKQARDSLQLVEATAGGETLPVVRVGGSRYRTVARADSLEFSLVSRDSAQDAVATLTRLEDQVKPAVRLPSKISAAEQEDASLYAVHFTEQKAEFEIEKLQTGDVVVVEASCPVVPRTEDEKWLVRLAKGPELDDPLLLDGNAWYVARPGTVGFRLHGRGVEASAYVRAYKSDRPDVKDVQQNQHRFDAETSYVSMLAKGKEYLVRVPLPPAKRVSINVQPIGEKATFTYERRDAEVSSVYSEGSFKEHLSAEATTPEGGEFTVKISFASKAEHAVFIAVERQTPYDGLGEGQRVRICRRHSARYGHSNWDPRMEEYLGQSAVVTEKLGLDPSGEFVVSLSDAGGWTWRVSSLCREPITEAG